MIISERLKKARKESKLTQEEVAKKLGINKQVISQLENNKPVTDQLEGDLFAALSYLYQVPYSYFRNTEETVCDMITNEDVFTYISNSQFLSWNAKGLLFHIFWNESLEPSFNTIRQFSGDNFENTKSALSELIYYELIFKYKIPGDIEVFGLNYLVVCESIRFQRLIIR